MKTLTQLCLVYVGELAHRFPETDLADLPVTILSQVLPYLSAAQLHRLDAVFKHAAISTVATWRRHLHQRWPHTHHRYPAVFGQTAPPDPHRHYMEKHFHELLRHAHFGQHTDPSCVLDMCLHHMILMRFPIREPSTSVVDQPLRDQLMSFAPYVQRLSITALQCCHLVQSADLMALLQRSVTTLDLHLGQDRYYHNMRAFLLQLLVQGQLEHIALYNTRLMQRHIKDLLRVCAGHFGYHGVQPLTPPRYSQHAARGAAQNSHSPSRDFRVQPSTSSQAGVRLSPRGSNLISPPRLHLRGEQGNTGAGHPCDRTSNPQAPGSGWLSDDDYSSGPDDDDDDTAEAELDLYDAALLLPSTTRPHSFLHRHVRLRHATRRGLHFRAGQADGSHNRAANFYAHPRAESASNDSGHKKAAQFYAHPKSDSSSTETSPDKPGADFSIRSQPKSSTKRSHTAPSSACGIDEPAIKVPKQDSQEAVNGESVSAVACCPTGKSDNLNKEEEVRPTVDVQQSTAVSVADVPHNPTPDSESNDSCSPGHSKSNAGSADQSEDSSICSKQEEVVSVSDCKCEELQPEVASTEDNTKPVPCTEGADTTVSTSHTDSTLTKPPSLDSSIESSNSSTSSQVESLSLTYMSSNKTTDFTIPNNRPPSSNTNDFSEPGSPPVCCREADSASPQASSRPFLLRTSPCSPRAATEEDTRPFGVKSMAVIECIECLGGNLGTYLAAVLPTWTGLENLTLTSTRTRSSCLSEELLSRLQVGQLRSLVLEDTPLCDNVLSFLTRALVSPRTEPLKVMKLSNNMQELCVREEEGSVEVDGPFMGTETLDLSYNTFVQSGIQHLARLLRHDTALRHLCLEACHFSESEVSTLLKAVQDNGRLETLSLAENLLSINSQYEVIRTINALPRLRSLNLNTCLIDAQIAVSDEFVSAVLRHPRLERLTLATNRLDMHCSVISSRLMRSLRPISRKPTTSGTAVTVLVWSNASGCLSNVSGGAGCHLLQRVLDGCHGDDATTDTPAAPLRWLDLGYNCIPGGRLLSTAQQVQARRPAPRRPFLTGLVLSGNLVSPHQRALILRAFTPLATQVVADTLDFSVPLAEHISQM